jgi:hypothetical protein
VDFEKMVVGCLGQFLDETDQTQSGFAGKVGFTTEAQRSQSGDFLLVYSDEHGQTKIGSPANWMKMTSNHAAGADSSTIVSPARQGWRFARRKFSLSPSKTIVLCALCASAVNI